LIRVGIIDYGAGNVRSVQNALKKLGVQSEMIEDNRSTGTYTHIIFPGVGHASSAMKSLRLKGLDHLIQNTQLPVLGICLGLQLMCTSTEEGNVSGLGIFDHQVIRFNVDLPIPHMGWNRLRHSSGLIFTEIPDTSFFYFVHSFHVKYMGGQEITSTYGETTFTSFLQKENYYGCQFHPEKSGKAGLRFLQNFLNL